MREISSSARSASTNFVKEALGECRPLFWGALWFSLFINVLMLAVPLFTMQVLDRVLSSGSFDTLLMLTIIVIVALLFMGVLQGLRGLIFSHIGRWLDERLSSEVIRKAVDRAILDPSVGSQPIRDLSTIRRFISSSAMGSLFDAPWAIVYFAVIFLIQSQLFAIVALCAVVLFMLALISERAPAKQMAIANDEQVKSMQVLDAIVRNGEVARSMGLLKNISGKWQQHNERAIANAFSASNVSIAVAQIARVLRLGLQVLLIGFGAKLVLDGQMSAGGIIAVSILSSKALAPFDAATSIYHGLVDVMKAYKRLCDLDLSVPDLQKTAQLPHPTGRVHLEKVYYRAPQFGRWLLRGVDMDIEPGDSIGIIGPSGSGKTTLARLMVGILEPSSGSVRLDGATLSQWGEDQLGDHLGYLPQDVELFNGTISENIARFSPSADDAAIIAAARAANVHEAILQFPQGYQTEIGQNGSLLSAGQRQRIGLARCFFGTPRLVILDEPNANLDVEGEHAFIQCLLNAKRLGITTVTIAHRLPLLRRVDKILVLKEGEVKLFGAAQEVLAKVTPDNTNIQPLRRTGSLELEVNYGE